MSARNVSASEPASRTRCAVSRASASDCRAVVMIRKPSAASASAIARPIFSALPVTSATLRSSVIGNSVLSHPAIGQRKPVGVQWRRHSIPMEETMATPPSASRDAVRGVVPKLIDLSEKVLFGDVWESLQISKRDRSLIVCATLIATYRPEQLRGHLERALTNGVTKEELSEVITHLAFYAGWPAAMTAANIAREVFEAHT